MMTPTESSEEKHTKRANAHIRSVCLLARDDTGAGLIHWKVQRARDEINRRAQFQQSLMLE